MRVKTQTLEAADLGASQHDAVMAWHEAEVARELRAIRAVYDRMESKAAVDDMETPPREYVTWRGWKMIRNVITDRIEQLTGERR